MPLYRYEAAVVFFVHIPKTGGTTIEAALRRSGAAEAMRFKGKRDFSRSTLQHIHADVYREAIGRRFYDWAFAVVRNPYTRFASEYRMKVLDAGSDEPIDQWAKANFARFRRYSYTRDNHIRPQTAFLVDHVERFRFEDGLEQPVNAACKRLGVEPIDRLPHKKQGSSEPIRMTRKTLELIGDFYADDFEGLGYDRDDPGRGIEVVS